MSAYHRSGSDPQFVVRAAFGRRSQVLDLIGSACWARTSDMLINSQLLYQLS